MPVFHTACAIARSRGGFAAPGLCGGWFCLHHCCFPGSHDSPFLLLCLHRFPSDAGASRGTGQDLRAGPGDQFEHTLRDAEGSPECPLGPPGQREGVQHGLQPPPCPGKSPLHCGGGSWEQFTEGKDQRSLSLRELRS